MSDEVVLCDRCDKPIPPGRLEALPTTEDLGKVGSLKKNYGSVSPGDVGTVILSCSCSPPGGS